MTKQSSQHAAKEAMKKAKEGAKSGKPRENKAEDDKAEAYASDEELWQRIDSISKNTKGASTSLGFKDIFSTQ